MFCVKDVCIKTLQFKISLHFFQMFPPWFNRLAPLATSRTRIFVALSVWLTVGSCLISRGALLLSQMSWYLAGIIMLGSALAGILKSKMVFDHAAISVITHIQNKPPSACVGGFFPIKTWGIVFFMMLLGSIVKRLSIPDEIKSGIYIFVGSGLLYSCRILWRAWKKEMHPSI